MAKNGSIKLLTTSWRIPTRKEYSRTCISLVEEPRRHTSHIANNCKSQYLQQYTQHPCSTGHHHYGSKYPEGNILCPWSSSRGTHGKQRGLAMNCKRHRPRSASRTPRRRPAPPECRRFVDCILLDTGLHPTSSYCT